MKAYYKTVGLAVLCSLFGKSRQAFYEQKWQEEKELFQDAIIVDLVRNERRIARRVGGRNLYHILKSELEARQVQVGRDRFFTVLRENDLLVKRRRKRMATTMSRHELPKYPNLAKALEVEQAEQLWVSDITYIRVGETFCYLILITDAYSHQVVGYHFSEMMDATTCVLALNMALAGRRYPARPLMHHSDRGLQYCSKAYVEVLKNNGIRISMTENGDPLENAIAERMNGILKDSFELDRTFSCFAEARAFIEQAIGYYNNRRPHSSCDLLTPNEAHTRTGTLKKHWKTFAEKMQARAEKNGVMALEAAS
ncbi:MAG: IS3 family transposase [Bacteroidota bacterium]